MKIKKYVSTFTYILPALVVFFSQFNLAFHFLSEYAYVEGYFVNYYDFVIHIVDLCLLGAFVWYMVSGKLWRNRSWLILSLFSVALWAVHNMIFRDVIVFYWSIRLLLYFLSTLSIHYAISNMKKKEKTNVGRYLVWAFSGAIVFQTIIICIQFFTNRVVGLNFLGESAVQTGISGTSAVVLSNGIFLRGYGTFPHPNVAGGFISVGILYLLCFTLFQKDKKRWLLIFPLLIGLVGLFLTWSRSAWTFSSISTLVIAYLYLRRRRSSVIRKGLGAVLIIMGLVLIWFAASNDDVAVGLRDRLISQSKRYDESVVQRNLLNQRAVEMYESNILTGVGAGKFIYRLSADSIYTSEGLRIMQPAHNVFLLASAELGFMALWVFSYFLYHSLKGLRRNCFLFFPLLFVVVVGNLDHYPITVPQGLLILISMDFLIAIGESIDN
ncbi:MAG: O-antigen ligase family protein [bacterium]